MLSVCLSPLYTLRLCIVCSLMYWNGSGQPAQNLMKGEQHCNSESGTDENKQVHPCICSPKGWENKTGFPYFRNKFLLWKDMFSSFFTHNYIKTSERKFQRALISWLELGEFYIISNICWDCNGQKDNRSSLFFFQK